MINHSLLAIFIPTFLVVSFTPGMCMTLSLTLGMSIGVRRTLWMMWGELVGVALVSIAAVAGVATLMLAYPAGFLILRFGGGGYLMYLGLQLWRNRGKMAVTNCSPAPQMLRRKNLVLQGFLTAVANPKGWAFMISLLPPFIDSSLPLLPQISILLFVLLSIEFISLIIYANGGKQLKTFLQHKGGVQLLNRTAGVLMIAVGLWLAAG